MSEELVSSLRSPSVDEQVVAQQIEDRHILRRGSLTSDSATKDEATVKNKATPSFFQRLFKSKTNSEKLIDSCKKDDLSAVKSYLKQQDIDVNVREGDKFQWTPLMWACKMGHTEIGKLLLQHHPKVNVQDSKLWSALILASRVGDLEMVEGLLDQGAEIDMQTNKEWTALMWAAQGGRTKVVKLLLLRGAKVDKPDENGWTPLMQASQEGHSEVVIVLLDYNANINHRSNSTWCALMAAAKNNHKDVMDILIYRGADINITRKDGSTTLHVVSIYEHLSEVMDVLIQRGASVDHQNKDGMTALMLAICKGHSQNVQTLINGKADLEKAQPETGWTALFFAANSGNLEIFKNLLSHGAATEIKGAKVTDVASFFKHKQILSELKRHEQAQVGDSPTTSSVQIPAHITQDKQDKSIDQKARSISVLMKVLELTLQNTDTGNRNDEKAPPRISSQPDSIMEEREGAVITLRIDAEGYSLTYKWIKDGKKLKDNNDYDGSSTNCLVIKQAHVKQMGRYWCTVRNKGGGESTSDPTELIIVDLVFSVDFKCEELVVWLEQKGISGEDLKVFKDQNIKGKSFLRLPRDKDEFNKKLKCNWTFGGWETFVELVIDCEAPGNQLNSTIEDFQSYFKLTDEQIDVLVEERDMHYISELSGGWYRYAGDPGLQLNEGEKHTISANPNLTDNQMKMKAALMKWKDNNPLTATFRNLLIIVLQLKDGSVAKKICKYFNQK